jgi:hypothetical protein
VRHINHELLRNCGFLCAAAWLIFPVLLMAASSYAAVRVSCHADRKRDVLVPYVYFPVGPASATGSGRVGGSSYPSIPKVPCVISFFFFFFFGVNIYESGACRRYAHRPFHCSIFYHHHRLVLELKCHLRSTAKFKVACLVCGFFFGCYLLFCLPFSVVSADHFYAVLLAAASN